MDKCCELFLQNCFPNNRKKDVFKEKHKCPTCGKELIVTFQEIASLGDEGNSDYIVIGADYIKQ